MIAANRLRMKPPIHQGVLALTFCAQRSPYHVTFGPLIWTVPKTTGMQRPSSAVGSVKVPRALGFCSFIFASTAVNTVEATRSTRSRIKRKLITRVSVVRVFERVFCRHPLEAEEVLAIAKLVDA